MRSLPNNFHWWKFHAWSCVQLNYPGNFLGRNNHARGEIFIFMHENINFVHEILIFMPENKKFSSMKFSCHDFVMHDTFCSGLELGIITPRPRWIPFTENKTGANYGCALHTGEAAAAVWYVLMFTPYTCTAGPSDQLPGRRDERCSPTAVQSFNSCTRHPDVHQFPVVKTLVDNMSKK